MKEGAAPTAWSRGHKPYQGEGPRGSFSPRAATAPNALREEQFCSARVSAINLLERVVVAGYVHPEFGGFCPTPRLRRELRVALFSILFGAMGGAAGVIALSVGHNATSSTETHVIAADAPIRPATMEATSIPGQGSRVPQADLATQDGRTKKEKIDGLSAAPADLHVGNHTCQADTSGGNEACLAIKPRRVRVRAVTDGPAMARIALGRTSAPTAAMSAQEQTGAMSPQDMPTTSFRRLWEHAKR